jgi:hypothetical protein
MKEFKSFLGRGSVVILLLCLILQNSIYAETLEASSKFHQQFDITFWQTMPFATLWGYFIDRQLSNFMYPGSAAHWQVIIPFAVAVSATNAALHAQRVTKNTKPVD